MTWQDALEIVLTPTNHELYRHERYRALCADDHPDHVVWRARMIEQAIGIATPPSYPRLHVQAAGALGAVSRVIAAAAAGEPVRATSEAIAARRATCDGCDQLVGGRCALCGCYYQLKIQLATEACPLGKWDAAR